MVAKMKVKIKTRSLDFHTTPDSQEMSEECLKTLFLILLWQMSFLHNEAALVVFAPSPHRAQLGENIVLPCSFKVDDPSINIQFFAMSWLFQGKEVLRFDRKGTLSQPRMFINQQDITKGIANMEIRNITINDIGKYRCTITYSPQKKFKDIDLSVYGKYHIQTSNSNVCSERTNH
ncbi:contactin-6-like [Lithobates pipiens]